MAAEYARLVEELQMLPERIETVLADREKIQFFASQYFNHDSVFFIGRNLDYALGLEGLFEAQRDFLYPLRGLRVR